MKSNNKLKTIISILVLIFGIVVGYIFADKFLGSESIADKLEFLNIEMR